MSIGDYFMNKAFITLLSAGVILLAFSAYGAVSYYPKQESGLYIISAMTLTVVISFLIASHFSLSEKDD